jgi:hypothetical protein
MTVNIADLGPVVRKNLNPMFKSALNRRGPENELGMRVRSFLGLLALNNRVGTQGGGEYHRELIVEATTSGTGKFVDSDDVIGAPAPGSSKEIKSPWREYRDVVKMKRIDKAKSQGNQLYNWESMWTQQVAQKLKDAIQAMEDACLLGTGAGAYLKSLLGIPYWINDTGVIGQGSFTVDRAVDTQFKSIIVDAASSSKLSIELLRQLRDAMETQRGTVPDVFLCGRNQLTNYQKDLEGANRERVSYTTLQIGDSEFRVLEFDGIPLISIPGYDPNRIDGINWDLWDFDVLVDSNTEELPHEHAEEEQAGFAFALHPLSVTTSHYAAELEIFPALTCTEPWNQGGIINLTA